jgi:hypothetical protein
MFDHINEKEAANANTSFSELMTNPSRNLIEGGILSCIRFARAAGICRSLIAETLFTYALFEVVPEGKITGAKSSIWYSQLLRFRDTIDAKITEIDNFGEDTHN